MDNARIWVVEDDERVQGALCRAARGAGYEPIGFADGESFLEAFEESGLGCIILDVTLPGMNGLRVQESLTSRQVTTPVIVVTGAGDISTAVQAFKAGAFDFLEKPFGPSELVAALERAIALQIEEQKRREESALAKSRLALLTPRENEVVEEILEGSTSKEIAAELGISPRTVEVHRERIMKKMEARSTAVLVRTVMTARSER